MNSSTSGIINVKIKPNSSSLFKEWQQVRCILNTDDAFADRHIIQLLEDVDGNCTTSLVEEYLLDQESEIVDISSIETKNVFTVNNLTKLTLVDAKQNKFEREKLVMYICVPTEKIKLNWMEAFVDAIKNTDWQTEVNADAGAYQPDLWPEIIIPVIDVEVKYPNKDNNDYTVVEISHGNTVLPSQVENTPAVAFSNIFIRSISRSRDDGHLKTSFYCLLMFDVDRINVPEPESASKRRSPIMAKKTSFHGYLHWAVVNIKTNNHGKIFLAGEEIVTYEPPAPPIRSGPHRFFFLVFRQPSRIEDDDLQLFAEDFVKRARFPYVEFAQTMSFGSPVGINGFYAAWEPDYCESMHAKLNYIPPEQYRSPRQQLDISMREKTAAIEKAKKDLYEAMNLSDILPPFTTKPLPSGINSFPSSISLSVVFEDSLEAREGFILPSLKLKKAPKVSYKCRSRGTSYSADSLFFTLVLSDPDCPSRTVHSLRELVHWLVVNIPGDRVSEGSELLPYLPVAPPQDSGLHRYVFMLYKQNGKMNEDNLTSCKTFFENRVGLNTNHFLTSLRNQDSLPLLDPQPVALEAFLSEWEHGVENVYSPMGIVLPSPFGGTKKPPLSLRLSASSHSLHNMLNNSQSRNNSPKQSLSSPLSSPTSAANKAPIPLPASPVAVSTLAPVSVSVSTSVATTVPTSPIHSASSATDTKEENPPSESPLGGIAVDISPRNANTVSVNSAAYSGVAISSSYESNEINARNNGNSKDKDSNLRSNGQGSTDDSLMCSTDDSLPAIGNSGEPLEREQVLKNSCADARASGAPMAINTTVVGLGSSSGGTVDRRRESTELKTNRMSVDEICKAYDIKSTTLFEGETLKKKFSTDFMFKDSYMWINTTTKSFHWAKSAKDKENPKNSKYLSLCGPSSRPMGQSNQLGEMKGVVVNVRVNDRGTGMVLFTASEEFLEIKGNPVKTNEMIKIVKTVMALQ